MKSARGTLPTAGSNSLPSHPSTCFVYLSSDLSSYQSHLPSPTNHLSLFYPPGYQSCLSPHLLFLTLSVCVSVSVCVCGVCNSHPDRTSHVHEWPECGCLYMRSPLVHFLCVCINITRARVWMYYSSLPSQQHWAASAKGLMCACPL